MKLGREDNIQKDSFFGAACKRMGKTSRGLISGGEILKRPGTDSGCRVSEEEDLSKGAFCKFMYCIMQHIFCTLIVNSINAYRVWRCCIMEVEQRNSDTAQKYLSLK